VYGHVLELSHTKLDVFFNEYKNVSVQFVYQNLQLFKIHILKALPFTREASVCYKTLLAFTHAHYLQNDIKVTHAPIG